MFIASRRVLKGTRRVLYPSKQPRENTVLCGYTWNVSYVIQIVT